MDVAFHRRPALAPLGSGRSYPSTHGGHRGHVPPGGLRGTGSGIGPALGQILTSRVPARLVWSTRNPRATYGDALVDEVLAAHPDALIWDTTERGKPDLVRVAHDVSRDFAAEAVLVVSNKAGTWSVVHGLERLGIRRSGPSGTRDVGSVCRVGA